jgi:hypothetical protein
MMEGLGAGISLDSARAVNGTWGEAPTLTRVRHFRAVIPIQATPGQAQLGHNGM